MLNVSNTFTASKTQAAEKMKKTIAFASLLSLTLFACKKDYTCECTTTSGTISTKSSTTINGTRRDAKTACEANNSSVTFGNISAEQKCEIK